MQTSTKSKNIEYKVTTTHISNIKLLSVAQRNIIISEAVDMLIACGLSTYTSYTDLHIGTEGTALTNMYIVDNNFVSGKDYITVSIDISIINCTADVSENVLCALEHIKQLATALSDIAMFMASCKASDTE